MANLSSHRVAMVKPFLGHETSVITAHGACGYSSTLWGSTVDQEHFL